MPKASTFIPGAGNRIAPPLSMRIVGQTKRALLPSLASTGGPMTASSLAGRTFVMTPTGLQQIETTKVSQAAPTSVVNTEAPKTSTVNTATTPQTSDSSTTAQMSKGPAVSQTLDSSVTSQIRNLLPNLAASLPTMECDMIDTLLRGNVSDDDDNGPMEIGTNDVEMMETVPETEAEEPLPCVQPPSPTLTDVSFSENTREWLNSEVGLLWSFF